jgi:hypothetical protein
MGVTVRKKRPVLYEVVRPEQRGGGAAQPSSAAHPAQPPSAVRPVYAPRKEPEKPLLLPKAPPGPETASEPEAGGGGFALSLSNLAVSAAVLIVLVFVAFVAGRQYGGKSGGAPPQPIPSDLLLGDGGETKPAPAARPAETNRPGTRAAEAAAEEKTSPARPKEPETAATPTVALQKGYTYIIIQHFNKNKRADAEAAAEFLRTQGIASALLMGGDIRLVATEAFLIEQRDAAAAERERRRAGQLQQRIKELGRQYDKRLREAGEPSYSFAECYPSLMK